MRIEHYIYIIVIMVMVSSCGSLRKSSRENREEKKIALSEMSGVGVMYGNARVSEEMSVVETEVHYSLPDSSGVQHVVKIVERKNEKTKKIDAEVTAKDSIIEVEEILTSSNIEAKEEKKISTDKNSVFFIISLLLLIAIAMAKRFSWY